MPATYCVGDQLAYITKEQAEKATEFLIKQKEVILYCGCCDHDRKVLIKITNVSFKHTGYQDFYEVTIEGIGPEGKAIKEEVDLAYIHFLKGYKAHCVGEELGFECDPCVEPFYWADEALLDKQHKDNIPVLLPVSGDYYEGIERQDLNEEHISSMINHWLSEPGMILKIPARKEYNNQLDWDWQWKDYKGKINDYSYTASSNLKSKSNAYTSDKAFDLDYHTAWVEGVKGDGINEWISLNFHSLFESADQLEKEKEALADDNEAPGDAFIWKPRLTGIVIIPGYGKSEELFRKNNHPKTLRAEIRFKNEKNQEEILTYRLRVDDSLRPQFFQTDDRTLFGECSLKLIIEEVYPGTHYDDTCISEIKLFFSDGL